MRPASINGLDKDICANNVYSLTILLLLFFLLLQFSIKFTVEVSYFSRHLLYIFILSLKCSFIISDTPHVGVAVGVVVALILIACAVVGAIFFLRKNKILGIKASGGLSFDYPAIFARRNAPANDTLQIIPNESAADGNDAVTSTPQTASATWKQEPLHAASSAANEVAPTLYEELRLGTEGAGFKRLK